MSIIQEKHPLDGRIWTHSDCDKYILQDYEDEFGIHHLTKYEEAIDEYPERFIYTELDEYIHPELHQATEADYIDSLVALGLDLTPINNTQEIENADEG